MYDGLDDEVSGPSSTSATPSAATKPVVKKGFAPIALKKRKLLKPPVRKAVKRKGNEGTATAQTTAVDVTKATAAITATTIITTTRTTTTRARAGSSGGCENIHEVEAFSLGSAKEEDPHQGASNVSAAATISTSTMNKNDNTKQPLSSNNSTLSPPKMKETRAVIKIHVELSGCLSLILLPKFQTTGMTVTGGK